MSQAEEDLPPIQDLFDPNSEAYLQDPRPQWLALKARAPLVWYEPWQAWIMTRMPDILECWRTEPLSSDFYDWEFAPQRPEEDQWSNFERAMIGHSLLSDKSHHRLVRKVAAPAFSRNVVDKIETCIKPDVEKLFDKLGNPESFDYITEVAEHIPFITITRMIGIPEKYWAVFQSVVMTFTEAWNPTISDERRAKAREDSNQAIDIIKEVIAERRLAPGEDDFLTILLKVESENEGFDEWDIITLVLALIGAGSDTTLVAQQWSTYALLKHPEQVTEALSSADSFSNAFSEIMRWGTQSKMGFARYAPENMSFLGEEIRKGQMILMMPHLKDHDPEYYDNPEEFDINRVFNPDVLFGYGPRFCIGAALAKRQVYLTMKELFKRFPNASLAQEPEKDGSDHNAVVFKKLIVKVN